MKCKLKLNKLCVRLINILSSHGFKTKWISSHPEVLNDILKEELLSQNIKLDFTERAVKNGKLTFQHLPKNLPNTRQDIFSLVASIFYALGIVTPAVLEEKLLIQSLWKLKLDWGDNIPKDILQSYQQWLSELHHIKEISISCWFNIYVGKKSDIELHIYSHASNSAHGAVAYFKSITSNKSVFVLSKSRL